VPEMLRAGKGIPFHQRGRIVLSQCALGLGAEASLPCSTSIRTSLRVQLPRYSVSSRSRDRSAAASALAERRRGGRGRPSSDCSSGDVIGAPFAGRGGSSSGCCSCQRRAAASALAEGRPGGGRSGRALSAGRSAIAGSFSSTAYPMREYGNRAKARGTTHPRAHRLAGRAVASHGSARPVSDPPQTTHTWTTALTASSMGKRWGRGHRCPGPFRPLPAVPETASAGLSALESVFLASAHE
jgi:hypothetical protein